MKKNNNLGKNFIDNCNPSDGGFILNDKIFEPVFAEPNASDEEKKRINKMNEDNWNKYISKQ
jgi:hypothetical protein